MKLLPILALALAVTPAQARTLEVVGTGDGMELVRAVGVAYTAANPHAVIVVPPSIGSGGGIAAVGAGKALLARVARPLKPAEAGKGLESRPIFKLPTALYVNRDLPVDGLSYEQLAGIYEGKIVNWSSVGGPDLRVKVVRREDTDSSFSVLRSSMPGWGNIKITSRSKTAVTTQEAVDTVASVKGAIGFGPFSRELGSRVKVLRLANLHPTDHAYPTAVTVSYVWHEDQFSDLVKAFVNFGNSKAAHLLLTGLGAVPVSPQVD